MNMSRSMSLKNGNPSASSHNLKDIRSGNSSGSSGLEGMKYEVPMNENEKHLQRKIYKLVSRKTYYL
jgi:hypothetical protein